MFVDPCIMVQFL